MTTCKDGNWVFETADIALCVAAARGNNAKGSNTQLYPRTVLAGAKIHRLESTIPAATAPALRHKNPDGNISKNLHISINSLAIYLNFCVCHA